ncbi:hypothetical protein [Caulobacter endophyticus]|uniref:hypothetical protein n=1 Tax=Caulobacter endophyticus TaxID=2172652 RepID=UPI00240F4173|nr:hypothetical protein [Caulobacter endophyticus]MDG2528416.1 hypothetical protein [Caulobacter endophyticus]
MVELIRLKPGEQAPDFSDEEPWLVIEASDDGRFFGTGRGETEDGKTIFYVSLAEDDHDQDRAIAAAERWAVARGVKRICVQAHPAD